jgi:hypothetical protein
MIAGAVVALPRRGSCVCAGCGRIVAWVATVALDLPDGSWAYVCWPCYVGEPLVRSGDVRLRWTGEGWLIAE